MPTNYTEHYALSQWEPGDKVQRTDFNADNAKIDAALKAEADARAALAGQLALKGNCRIVYTTYVGTGEYGPDHPNTLTFDAPPMLVFVCGGGYQMGFLFRNWNLTMPTNTEAGGFHTTWGENSVSWHNPYGVGYQYNSKGATYHVIAFLELS